MTSRIFSRQLRTLTAYKRLRTGKYAARELREQEKLPGILYGKQFVRGALTLDQRKFKRREKEEKRLEHTRGVLISTNQRDIEKELRDRGASFQNTLYKLKLVDLPPTEFTETISSNKDSENEEGNDSNKHEATTSEGQNAEEYLVIPRDLQVHALKSHPVHVNFLKYDPTVGVKLDVPVYFADEDKCPGILRGGYLNKDYFMVKCLVKGMEIPASLKVSLEGTNVGDRVLWDELEIPDNVRVYVPYGLRYHKTLVLATIKGKREQASELSQNQQEAL